jgi:hypothetical protein
MFSIDMTQRFLTLELDFIPEDEFWLIICDYRWWNLSLEEVKQWAEQSLTRGLVTEGMIIKFASSEEQTLFLMRWANG